MIEWIYEGLARLDWGPAESVGCWPADLEKCKSVVHSMQRPWTSIRYSKHAFRVREMVSSAISDRMEAPKVWSFLNDKLRLWKCADSIEEIAFRVTERRARGFNSLHLLRVNRQSEKEYYFCQVIITDKPKLGESVRGWVIR